MNQIQVQHTFIKYLDNSVLRRSRAMDEMLMKELLFCLVNLLFSDAHVAVVIEVGYMLPEAIFNDDF